MSRRSGGSWSIAERTTRWFAINTAIVALVIATVAAYFVRASVHRELQTLVHEELDEIALAFRGERPGDYDERQAELFRSVVEMLQEQHPSNLMGWRLWDATTGKLLDEFGARAMLPLQQPNEIELEVTRVVEGHLWTRSMRLQDGYIVGIAIDGSPQTVHLRRFAVLCLVLALVSGAVTFLGGQLLIRRSCDYLHQIAASTRDLRTTEDPEPLVGAPQEIRDIVDALGTRMKNIRSEQERARLLTTGLAHELGAPLQNLIGETEVALMADKSPGEYRRVLESQLEELRDIGHAVGNLMTLASIEQAHGSRELEQLDLEREADVRLRRERSHAERRGVAFEVASSGDLGLSGDREALWLAVTNLVANAIDYTPAGGRVQLTMEGGDGVVRVVVDDSGPGIADDQRDKIFEPFYRGPTAKGRRAGYGLGLSIARKAVDNHGGELLVERSPLGGARFRLELPRFGRTEH